MLIALFTILFLGGSTSGALDFIADTQDEVRAVMERDDRRRDALSTLKELEARTEARNDVVENVAQEMQKLLADRNVTDADIDTIWYRYFAQREAYNRDLLSLRFQLRDQLTREEWQQVFGGE